MSAFYKQDHHGELSIKSEKSKNDFDYKFFYHLIYSEYFLPLYYYINIMYNNKDEDNHPNIVNDINYQVSSKKFGQKSFDSVPKEWVLIVLYILKISSVIITFLKYNMKKMAYQPQINL